MCPSHSVALRQVEDKPKSKSDGVRQMIHLALTIIALLILVPLGLFLVAFVFLIVMTIVATPFYMIKEAIDAIRGK